MKVFMLNRRRGFWKSFALTAAILGGAFFAIAGTKQAAAPSKAPVPVAVDPAPLPRTENGELSFAPIVKRVTPSVVKVVVRQEAKEMALPGSTPFDDPTLRRFFGPFLPDMPSGRTFRHPPTSGLGSGVIVSPDGYILTNNHVVDEADKVTVTLSDGREFSAKVVGTDEKTDVAVIKVDTGEKLPAVTFANSEAVEVGDRVLAVGNPFGLGQTVTTGIVSATGRAVSLGLDYEDFIQTDAAINPGNSGGALVDMRGRLIGLNTAIFSRSGGFQGIGFAIPSDLARQVMDSLVQYGRVTRGYLGVMIQDLTPPLAEQFGLKSTEGVLVGDVASDGPAADAGFKSGDVVLAWDGKSMADSRRLKFAVAATAPGSSVDVRVLRNGKEQTIKVKVGELPGGEEVASAAAPGRDEGVLNDVGVTDLTPAVRREFEIPGRVQGAVITQVGPGSAAAEAGLTPGDVILEINQKPVRSADEAIKLTEEYGDGKTLLKLWSRGGTHFVVVDESNRKASGR